MHFFTIKYRLINIEVFFWIKIEPSEFCGNTIFNLKFRVLDYYV